MNIYQQLPCPSLITDFQGSILQANEALVALFDIDFIRYKDSHLDTLMLPASAIFMQTHVWPLLLQSKSINEIYLIFNGKQNNRIPVMVNCQQIEYQSESAYCWVFFVAVERSNFEAELVNTRNQLNNANINLEKSKKELEESSKNLNLANKEMERFIYTVSHDLKSPLITISAFTQQLLSELTDKLTEKQLHRFQRILANVEGMDSMLADLLVLSKIVREDIDKKNINLEKIISLQCGFLHSEIIKNEVTINIQKPIPTLWANETLVSQCILNLLSNAINYRSLERLLKIDITFSYCPEATTVHIQDNGIGIAVEDQERVFDIFEQVSAETGTGIGLAIIKTAMKKLNGEISLKSALNCGSCFSLHFPNR